MQTGLARIERKKSLLFTKNQLESAYEKTLSEIRLQTYIQLHHRLSTDPFAALIDPEREREREREREGEREREREREIEKERERESFDKEEFDLGVSF